jgi:hypothetical protein
MKPENAKKEFENYLKKRGLNQKQLVPSAGIDDMLSFYGTVRADECNLDEGQDQLLFQWGTYNWGHGEHFELDITRQIIIGESEDENIWQLSLTFIFSSDKKLRELGNGNKWCHNPKELIDFTGFVQKSEPYVEVAARLDMDVELDYEQAG